MNIENKFEIVSYKHHEHVELIEENITSENKSTNESENLEASDNKKYKILQNEQVEKDNTITIAAAPEHNDENVAHEDKFTVRVTVHKKCTVYLKKKKPVLLKSLPMILGTFIYLITLIGCYDQYHVCLKKYPPKAMLYGFLVTFIAGFFYTLQIYLFFKRKVCYKYVLLEMLIICFLCFIYDTGSDLIHHGAYNRIILLVSIFICGLLFTIFAIIHKLFKKCPYIVLVILVSIPIWSYIHLHTVFSSSCKDWSKGFKSTKILNGSKCDIFPPEVCYYRIFDGYFDLSTYLKISCKSDHSSNQYENIQPHLIDGKAKIIGFPLTTKWEMPYKSRNDIMQKTVLNEMINMEDNKVSNMAKENVEITINYHLTPPKVDINVKPDENLIKDRAKIYKESASAPLVKNVLYFFIDSVSRANFSKKLPKFYKWIEEKYSGNIINNPVSNKQTHEAFQFFKLHGVGRYTRINMVPTFFGVYNTQTEKEAQYFIKYYKEKGFITGYSMDYCSKEFFEIEDTEMSNLKWHSYDHEFISLYCDPNYSPYDDPFSMSKGANSFTKKCLYNKYAVEHEFDYLTKFWTAYKDQNKFYKMGVIDAHEGTYEAIKHDDHVLYEFFSNFEKNGHLQDTIMIIQTDHGNTQPGPFSMLHLEDFAKELTLPTLFVLIPKRMRDYSIIRKRILSNEQKYITPFTIHNSLLAILNDNSIPFSEHDKYSIFSEIPDNRTCLDFKIENSLCRCRGMEESD